MARPPNDPDPSRKPGSIWQDIRDVLGVKTTEDRVVATAIFLGAAIVVYVAVNELTSRVELPDVADLALMVALGPLAATLTVAVLLFIHRHSR